METATAMHKARIDTQQNSIQKPESMTQINHGKL